MKEIKFLIQDKYKKLWYVYLYNLQMQYLLNLIGDALLWNAICNNFPQQWLATMHLFGCHPKICNDYVDEIEKSHVVKICLYKNKKLELSIIIDNKKWKP